jgi:hypothetical protein
MAMLVFSRLEATVPMLLSVLLNRPVELMGVGECACTVLLLLLVLTCVGATPLLVHRAAQRTHPQEVPR